jgi:hypothetical protein
MTNARLTRRPVRQLLPDALGQLAKQARAAKCAHADGRGDGPADNAEGQGQGVGAEPVLGEGLAAVVWFVVCFLGVLWFWEKLKR